MSTTLPPRLTRRDRAACERGAKAEACPECKAAMVPRTRRADGHTFLGCSRFPTCRATRPDPNQPDNGEQEAFEAKREMWERRSGRSWGFMDGDLDSISESDFLGYTPGDQ